MTDSATVPAPDERLIYVVDDEQDLLDLADLERPDSPLDMKDWDVGQITREMGATFEDRFPLAVADDFAAMDVEASVARIG